MSDRLLYVRLLWLSLSFRSQSSFYFRLSVSIQPAIITIASAAADTIVRHSKAYCQGFVYFFFAVRSCVGMLLLWGGFKVFKVFKVFNDLKATPRQPPP